MPSYDGSSSYATVPTASDSRIAALTIPDVRWAVGTLTYSFPDANALWASNYPTAYSDFPPTSGFTPLTEANREQFRIAISKWAELINLDIVEVPDGQQVGELRAAYYGTNVGYAGFAYYPGYGPWAGDIWFSPTTAGYKPGIQPGWPHPYQLLLHEIGHALGLSHPFEGPTTLPPDLSNFSHTVMAYDTTYTFQPTTPMVLDVLAIQWLYGANHNTRAGNDTYAYDDSRPYHETIWDGGGIDTIRYDGSRDAMISLIDGSSSRIGQEVRTEDAFNPKVVDNVWIAYGASIENAQGGSGNDRLLGNELANHLDGGAGNDTLFGGLGNDVFVGGSGADEFDFSLWDNDVDTIEDFTSEDSICLYGAVLSGAATSGDGSTVGRYQVQCLSQSGTTTLFVGTNTTPGPEAVIHLTGDYAPTRFTLDGQFIRLLAAIPGRMIPGTAGDDLLTGTAGDDTIDAGTGLDTLACTGPLSAYRMVHEGDHFTLSGPEGTDTLRSVERVRFSDNLGIATDIDGHGGMAYRLYQAAFDRAPDTAGLGFHMRDLDQGVSASTVSAHFIESPEFQSKYGALDDRQFISQLYANVLHRAADDAGLRYHLDEFAQGQSRADMLTHFSESPENQANVIGQIQDGMTYVPFA